MSLRSPRRSKHGSADAADYQARFRRHCHTLLLWGYEKIRQQDHSQSEEDAITEKLVEAIRRILREQNAPRWIGRFFVRDQVKQSIPGVAPSERPIIDIEMESAVVNRPVFHFEAKRLRKDDTHSVSNYVGPPGIGGFLDGSYSQKSREGGMIGYMQSNTPDHWQDAVQRKFSTDQTGYGLTSDEQWSKPLLVPGFPHLYLTIHLRPQLGRIAIYHVFLDFREKPAR